MSKIKTREQAEQILEGWRQRIVPEWEVYIDWSKPPDDDSNTAMVYVNEVYNYAPITLMEGWFTKERRKDPSGSRDFEREVDLVHELLHVLDRDRKRFETNLVDNELISTAAKIARHMQYLAREGEIERIARLLVQLAPLR